MQFSFGGGLIRTLVSVGFLGCLIAEQTRSTEAATGESPIVTSAAGMGICWSPPGLVSRLFADPNHAYLLSDGFAGSSCKVASFRFNCSDFILSRFVESSALDEFEVPLESDQDSIKMLRVDVQLFAFDIDRTVTGPEIMSKGARNTRPNISPPLLV